jgi:hypothetical protein
MRPKERVKEQRVVKFEIQNFGKSFSWRGYYDDNDLIIDFKICAFSNMLY